MYRLIGTITLRKKELSPAMVSMTDFEVASVTTSSMRNERRRWWIESEDAMNAWMSSFTDLALLLARDVAAVDADAVDENEFRAERTDLEGLGWSCPRDMVVGRKGGVWSVYQERPDPYTDGCAPQAQEHRIDCLILLW